jgi:hypothetical protein
MRFCWMLASGARQELGSTKRQRAALRLLEVVGEAIGPLSFTSGEEASIAILCSIAEPAAARRRQ